MNHAFYFLDEPTAGVDVELRKDMWRVVNQLRDRGVTIILTTHYIEEAEETADRIGILRAGEMLLVEEKQKLMQSMGQQSISLQLAEAMQTEPAFVQQLNGAYKADTQTLKFNYQNTDKDFINKLFDEVKQTSLVIANVKTESASLEEIFVDYLSKS